MKQRGLPFLTIVLPAFNEEVYLVANLSRLSDDARLALFDAADIRSPVANVFYFGVGAEWWFQSSYR